MQVTGLQVAGLQVWTWFKNAPAIFTIHLTLVIPNPFDFAQGRLKSSE